MGFQTCRFFFRMVFRRIALWTVLVTLCLPTAHALDRDQRALMTGGLYGAGLGALAGLASVPLNRSGRSVFIGASLGLYLGIVMGIYHIHHRDDPENPLRAEQLRLQDEIAQSCVRADFTILRY